MKSSRLCAARLALRADRRSRQRLIAGSIIAAALAMGMLTQRLHESPPITAVPPARQPGRPLQTLYHVAESASQHGWTAALRQLSGDLWREAGQPQRALADWLLASDSIADPALEQNIAQAAFALGDWPTALRAWERAAALAPQNSAVLAEYALLLAALEPSAAQDALTRAASATPAQAALSDALRTAIANGNDEHERLMRTGMVFAEHALWLHARAAFQTAAALGSDPLALAYFGYAIDQTGGNGSAQVSAAARAAPQQPQVRLLEGLHLRAQNDLAGSLAALSAAALLDPASPVLLAELGTAHLNLGDYASARHWYQQAVLLSGGAEPYAQLLQSLQTTQDPVPDQPPEATPDEAPQHTEPDALPDDSAQQGPAG